jgi:hypothetical protein
MVVLAHLHSVAATFRVGRHHHRGPLCEGRGLTHALTDTAPTDLTVAAALVRKAYSKRRRSRLWLKTVNLRTWGLVSDSIVMVRAFAELRYGVVAHTRENSVKYGHNFNSLCHCVEHAPLWALWFLFSINYFRKKKSLISKSVLTTRRGGYTNMNTPMAMRPTARADQTYQKTRYSATGPGRSQFRTRAHTTVKGVHLRSSVGAITGGTGTLQPAARQAPPCDPRRGAPLRAASP